jgi:hypothetical protein
MLADTLIVYITLYSTLPVFFFICISITLFSIIWFALELFSIIDSIKKPFLGFIATTIDVFILSVFIYLTNITSIIVGGYIYMIAICSLNTKTKQGLRVFQKS